MSNFELRSIKGADKTHLCKNCGHKAVMRMTNDHLRKVTVRSCPKCGFKEDLP